MTRPFPADAGQGGARLSRSGPRPTNRLCAVHSVPWFWAFLYISLVILPFETALKGSAEVPSSVPERKKATVRLVEKTRELDKLRAGLSDSAVGCGFREINRHCIYLRRCL